MSLENNLDIFFLAKYCNLLCYFSLLFCYPQLLHCNEGIGIIPHFYNIVSHF